MGFLVRVFADGRPVGYLTESAGRPFLARHAKDADRYCLTDPLFLDLSKQLTKTESCKLPSQRRAIRFEAIAANVSANPYALSSANLR